jgi:hypothetical protein
MRTIKNEIFKELLPNMVVEHFGGNDFIIHPKEEEQTCEDREFYIYYDLSSDTFKDGDFEITATQKELITPKLNEAVNDYKAQRNIDNEEIYTFDPEIEYGVSNGMFI